MSDDFVTLAHIMSTKLREQAGEIMDLQYQLEDLRKERNELEGEIGSLKYQIAAEGSYHSELRSKVDQLLKELNETREKLHAYRLNDPLVTCKAVDWLEANWKDLSKRDIVSPKIHAIREVREITGFGLKDAKDFFETWLSRVPA